jgi:hypothetical protein
VAKQKFQCRMIDYDADDEWTEIEAYMAEYAAADYAQQCDSRSGGGITGFACVHVKTPEDKHLTFDITIEYSKDFHARLVQNETTTP